MSDTEPTPPKYQRVRLRRQDRADVEVFTVDATMTIADLRSVVARRLVQEGSDDSPVVEALHLVSESGQSLGTIDDAEQVAAVLLPSDLISYSPSPSVVSAEHKRRETPQWSAAAAAAAVARSKIVEKVLKKSPTNRKDLIPDEDEQEVGDSDSVPRDRTLSLEDALIATAVAQRKADAEAEIQKLTMQLSELRAKIRIEEERHHNVVTEHRASDGATSQVSTRSSSMDPSAPDEGSVTPIESGATSTDGSGAASVEMKEISSNPQPSVDDLPDDEASDEIGDVELEVEKEKDERPQRECSSEEAPLIGAHGRAMYSMERKKAYWWSFGLKLALPPVSDAFRVHTRWKKRRRMYKKAAEHRFLNRLQYFQDDEGCIAIDDLRPVLQSSLGVSAVKADKMLQEADFNADGRVNCDEFVEIYLKARVPPVPQFDRCVFDLDEATVATDRASNIDSKLFESIRQSEVNFNRDRRCTNGREGCCGAQPLQLPWDRFSRIWDFVVMILVAYTLVEVPLQIGLRALTVEPSYFAFSMAVDLFFCADILFAFLRAHVTSKGQLVATPAGIVRFYFTHWFLLDFFGSIPISTVGELTNLAGSVSTGALVVRFLSLLKLLRGARIIRRRHQKKGWKSSLVAKEKETSRRFFILAGVVVYTAHISACMWAFATLWSVDYYGNFPTDSWAHEYLGVANIDFVDKGILYWWAFYWAVTTLTTVGYGDLTPHSYGEAVWSTFVMIAGVGIFSYIIGSLTSVFTAQDVATKQQMQERARIEAWMEQSFAAEDLQKDDLKGRIMAHFEHKWTVESIYEEKGIMSSLPKFLREEVALYRHHGIRNHAAFLCGLDKSATALVVSKLKPLRASPDQEIIRAGSIPGKSMYILTKGHLGVVHYPAAHMHAHHQARFQCRGVKGEGCVAAVAGSRTFTGQYVFEDFGWTHCCKCSRCYDRTLSRNPQIDDDKPYDLIATYCVLYERPLPHLHTVKARSVVELLSLSYKAYQELRRKLEVLGLHLDLDNAVKQKGITSHVSTQRFSLPSSMQMEL